MRLFYAEVCGAGELVSENCNHKYSYSHVPVIRVSPSVLFVENYGRWRAAGGPASFDSGIAVPIFCGVGGAPAVALLEIGFVLQNDFER